MNDSSRRREQCAVCGKDVADAWFARLRNGIVGERLSRRLWPLNAEVLVAWARRRTGLRDFGEPPLEPALTLLTQSLDEEDNLHPLGRFLIWHHLEDLLATRLRLVETWRHAQSLEAARIERPLFITGMPRSGSTFLHELLAADPDNCAPRVWEVMFPVPLPGNSRRDSRIRRAAAQLRWFRRLAPGADEVHPIRAESPQECEAIHSYTFLSEEFLSTCWVPRYEAWLRQADFVPAYLWQKRFLQHLQGAGPAKRWVLKSPDHAHSLAALLTVFPDAVVVQTHRAPADVLRSSLQLVEVLHGLFGRSAGREERARREARVLADAMERLLRFREAHPELAGRFLDVKYSELVAEPLAVASRIYEHWGVPLTAPAREAMRHLASQRSRYSKRRLGSKPVFSGADLGGELRPFQPYCSRFGFAGCPGNIAPTSIPAVR
jgi:hypothetical protein